MQKSQSTSILVAGVAVIDFVFRLDTLPRQAEKYRARDATMTGGGGAANATVAIARLGGKALLAARLGDDAVGQLIIDDLGREGVDCSLTRRFAGRRSSFSSVFVTDAGERQIVNFRDILPDDSAAWIEHDMSTEIRAALADTRWPGGALAAMQTARNRAVPGILDAEAPVHESEAALKIASHVAFSAQGLADFTGESDLTVGLRSAAATLPGWVGVTDGEHGAYWIENGRIEHEPAYEIEAIDTLAAGDIWHGAFALRLGEAESEREAIRYANAVAAIKCTRFGGRAGAPTRTEADAFIAAQRATK